MNMSLPLPSKSLHFISYAPYTASPGTVAAAGMHSVLCVSSVHSVALFAGCWWLENRQVGTQRHPVGHLICGNYVS
jgi:hypothetical protein